MQRLQQPITGIVGAIALGIFLHGCGGQKIAQCREILQTIQQAEGQRALGEQTRETQQANIQLYQTLADDLAAMDIKNRELQERQTGLVDAYRGVAAAMTDYMELSNDKGRVSYREGDTEKKAAIDAVMADQRKAQNQLELAVNLFYSSCD